MHIEDLSLTASPEIWNGYVSAIIAFDVFDALFWRTPKRSERFNLCVVFALDNCVVDDDMMYYEGIKIRIANIDTPETHEPRCAEEAQRGAEAILNGFVDT